MPASRPLAKVAVMMVLALSRLMRKSVMEWSLVWDAKGRLTEKAQQGKRPAWYLLAYENPARARSAQNPDRRGWRRRRRDGAGGRAGRPCGLRSVRLY